jgi:hypothetical protein
MNGKQQWAVLFDGRGVEVRFLDNAGINLLFD